MPASTPSTRAEPGRSRPGLPARIGLRALLVAAGVVVGLGIAEVVLRAMDVVPVERSPLRGYHRGHPRYGWVGTPGRTARFDGDEFDVVISIADDGYRRQEVPRPAADRAPTVVFLGDSFTWGWGVERGEVFTDRLQELVGERWRVVNHGVNAWGTSQQRLLLEDLLAKAPPDRVVVMFFANDPEECVDDRGGKRPVHELVDGRLEARNLPVRTDLTSPFRELTKRSLALSLTRALSNDLAALLKQEHPAHFLEVAAAGEEPRGWPVCAALIEDMARLCAAAGTEFQVVYIPVAAEVAGAPDRSIPQRTLLAAVCERAGIPWLDLTPGLHAVWLDSPQHTDLGLPLYFPRDQHWTAAGHAAGARLIRDWWDR